MNNVAKTILTMQLLLLDMELTKRESSTGRLETHGENHGEKKDTLELLEEKENVD